MKINEIYKELDEFLSDNHYLKHKDLATWDMQDWMLLSQLTQSLVAKKQNEKQFK